MGRVYLLLVLDCLDGCLVNVLADDSSRPGLRRVYSFLGLGRVLREILHVSVLVLEWSTVLHILVDILDLGPLEGLVACFGLILLWLGIVVQSNLTGISI